GAVETHEAALRQAPVEKARNDAYNATHARVKAAAIAAGRDIKDAEKEAAEAGTRAGNAAYAAKEKKVKDTLETGTPTEIAAMRAEMEQSAITAQGTAAYESAVDQAVAADAKVAALNQAAASPNRLEAAQRLAVSTESQVASIAAQQGADRERYELTRPGQALNRSFQQAEAGAGRRAQSQILAERAEEAGNDPNLVELDQLELDENNVPVPERDSAGNLILERDPAGNYIPDVTEPGGFAVQYKVAKDAAGKPLKIRDRIKSFEPDMNNILQLERQAENAFKSNQHDKGIAIMNSLGRTNQGRDAMRRIQHRVFGRTETQTVDPTLLGGMARELWEQSRSGVSGEVARDFYVPVAAGYDGFPSEAYAASGWTTKRDYHTYVTQHLADQPALADAAVGNMLSMLSNPDLVKKMDADNWQEMYRFIQDPKINEILADYDAKDSKGTPINTTEIMKTVEQNGRVQGGGGKIQALLGGNAILTADQATAYNAHPPDPSTGLPTSVAAGATVPKAALYNAYHPDAPKREWEYARVFDDTTAKIYNEAHTLSPGDPDYAVPYKTNIPLVPDPTDTTGKRKILPPELDVINRRFANDPVAA
ncbi:MAG TPA: hypothetical protein VMT30_08660, partial [Candidatus Saccharimonadia bacterium]|nr:hypothetical protein [Candidatus Saccharimonadia bacterium]